MGAYVNKAPAARGKRARLRNLLLLAVLLLAGALLDPSIIRPFGPLAARPEQIDARFVRCGQGAPPFACVVDGDTFRLGARSVRITGIDAPELHDAKCPAELALANRAADRLTLLLNQKPIELVGHVFNDRDKYGRDLRVVWHGDTSIGDTLQKEGLAHRYVGVKSSWC